MNKDDLAKLLSRPGYAIVGVVGSRPAPKLERAAEADVHPAVQAEAPDTADILVRVTSFRRRLLDEDNLCAKYHVDCCRYAGLIPSDAPQQTHIEVRQQKVKTKAEEGTLIEIL